jgi:multiple sugar transport system permease protein
MVDVIFQPDGAVPARVVRKRSRLRATLKRKSSAAFLMTLPLILLIGILVIYPAFYSLHLATLNKSMQRFVGFGNFEFLLNRETFWLVVRQSCIFAISAVIFKALIGFIVAHFVHNIPAKGQRKWRGMLLVPWVIPPAMSTLAWLWLFDPSYSAINYTLSFFGIGPIPWTGDANWARFSVILVNIWYGAPFFMIMYLAALKSVPDQLVAAHLVRDPTDDAQYHSDHHVVFADRDLCELRYRAHTHVRRTARPHPHFCDLGVQGRHRRQRYPVGRQRLALHAADTRRRCDLHPARHHQTRERSLMTIEKAAPTGAARYGSISRDRTWALRWSYFFLTLFAIFSLVPPLYMLITSLKGSAEISAATNPWWVFHPTLENYVRLLTSNQFLTFFRNSTLVSILVVIITMLISVPAAFALARMRFWGSATLATGVFLTYLVPDSLLFLPLFKMFALFGDLTGIQLVNRWYVLVIVYPTLTVPFCTWIMIGYFASIPKELDEAAVIDGATWFQTLTRIFIPVALPGLIAATIFAFTVSWAQFLYPLVFTTSTDQLVLPVGIITTLIKGDVFNWGQIMAGALLGAAPPLIIYAFLMDYYIAGLTAGATKG